MGVSGASVKEKLRWAVNRTREISRTEGASAVVRRARGYAKKRFGRPEPWPQFDAAESDFHGMVLMLAGRDPVQCWHYRVEQKQQACAELDIPFAVVDPSDHAGAMSAVQLASCLIVYRQAHSRNLVELVNEARRLAVPVIYEADDVVYRHDLVSANPNLSTLPADLQKAVIDGATGYAEGLALADAVLASTELLAADMLAALPPRVSTPAAGQLPAVGRSAVVDNGIDEGMWSIQRGIDEERASGRIRTGADGLVVIGYGSGSRAHDHDLAIVAPALAAVLSRHDHVKLRLFGPLALPTQLAPFAERVERFPMLPASEFLWEMAHCDIAIAPLADVAFNRYKSQVKYLEAGLLRLPFVASPTVYANYVEHGRTGLIASDIQEWLEALESLVNDTSLRRALGEAAAEHVRQWSVATSTTAQMQKMLADFAVKVA